MPGAIRSVRLSEPQVAYLTTAAYLPSDLRDAVINAADLGGPGGPIAIDAATADILQSALTDRLGQAGFDADYDVTDEGAMLEDLIDAFADA
jgi:hypothetical protein